MSQKGKLYLKIAIAIFIVPLFFYMLSILERNSISEHDNNNQEQVDSEEKDKEKEKEKDKDNNKEEDKDKNKDKEKDKDKEKIYWGVDSANLTDDKFYSCVVDHFDKPAVWGRYLGDIENVSTALTKDEIKFLHSKDIKILVIYNLITDARGYDHGKDHANEAIKMAEQLGVPEGKAIFADIEPDFQVDAEFIKGWFDEVSKSKYEPGIYGVFSEEQKLFSVFGAAAEENKDLKNKTILWTAYPQEGITSKEKAPEYKPVAPEGSFVLGWQYGIDAETCNIDTNLFKGELLNYLW
ncbi:glycoside hydrolase domain-containing protein [Bacillus niameyensis]|uniref:glycoside hydrolase domain-containing protein n=1 Tax=Bacillus niameyensis TaxID=1522308 RepID=UPI00078349C5|nr:glycoside hydrolase domain-containing protein [Bacillus niameyensis]